MTLHTIKINLEGLDTIDLYISGMERRLKDGVERGINKSLVEIKDVARVILASRTRVGEPREGAINSNWSEPKCTYYGNTIQGTIHNYSPHWRAAEFGTADKSSGLDEDTASATDMIRPIGDSPLKFKYLGKWYTKWEVHGQEPIAYARGAMIGRAHV